MALAELMLSCLGRPERPVADAALDYFISLNTIPVAHRAPPFQTQVFAAAMPMLLRQVRGVEVGSW